MSQTVVVRRIAATPARPAAEAWGVIVDLLAPPGSIARQELDRAGGVAMSLIAAEAMRDSPIVVHGVGSRLRLVLPLRRLPEDQDWSFAERRPCGFVRQRSSLHRLHPRSHRGGGPAPGTASLERRTTNRTGRDCDRLVTQTSHEPLRSIGWRRCPRSSPLPRSHLP